MKSPFLLLLILNPCCIFLSQKIKIHVTEVKDYLHSDSVRYDYAIQNSRSDNEVRSVNGFYRINVKKNMIKFRTLKSKGTRSINSIKTDNNIIEIQFTDDYLNEENGNKLNASLIIDKGSNRVIFTYYDPIYKYTLAQDFTKNKIKEVR